MNYAVGDVVEGGFSCANGATLCAIVEARVPDANGLGRPGFYGVVLAHRPGKGYGAWGYDDEIVVTRAATQDDRSAAAAVKKRVSDDHDRIFVRHG